MKRDIWLFLFTVGVLFFNWPIMSIFRSNLVIALFIVWAVFILLMAVTSFLSKRHDGGG
jgi:hypothetical protein